MALVEYVFGQMLAAEHDKNRIALADFLLLADECVKGLVTKPLPGCPLSAKKLKELRATLSGMIDAAWIRLARALESDEETSDAQLLEASRQRNFIRHHSALTRSDISLDAFLSMPGRWITGETLRNIS